jgi:hypothetical protein
LRISVGNLCSNFKLPHAKNLFIGITMESPK